MKKLLLLCIVVIFSQAREIPSENQVQGRLNIINGSSTECVMHHFYTNSGWTQIEGEVGRNGIDGLYYKKQNGIIKEVLVAESKWNKSRLGLSGKGKAVKQMSQKWVLATLDKLIKKMHTGIYSTIRNFVSHNQYRARLFRMKPIGKSSIQITIFRIKNKGLNAFDEIQDTQLSPIDINAPRNAFENGIVESYNSCRRTYMKKYLDVLNDREIDRLLKSNQLKKNDVLREIRD